MSWRLPPSRMVYGSRWSGCPLSGRFRWAPRLDSSGELGTGLPSPVKVRLARPQQSNAGEDTDHGFPAHRRPSTAWPPVRDDRIEVPGSRGPPQPCDRSLSQQQQTRISSVRTVCLRSNPAERDNGQTGYPSTGGATLPRAHVLNSRTFFHKKVRISAIDSTTGHPSTGGATLRRAWGPTLPLLHRQSGGDPAFIDKEGNHRPPRRAEDSGVCARAVWRNWRSSKLCRPPRCRLCARAEWRNRWFSEQCRSPRSGVCTWAV